LLVNEVDKPTVLLLVRLNFGLEFLSFLRKLCSERLEFLKLLLVSKIYGRGGY